MPLSTSHAEIRVADRLARLRKEKGLSLSRLADLSGLSQPYLSRVENHKASLPIASLERVAQALGVPISAFFQEEEKNLPLTVCRAGEGKKGRLRGGDGFLYEMLAAAKSGKLMEPMIVDLSTARRQMPLKSHAGDEFNYILEGETTFHYGKESILLQAGDAVYYDATVPHCSRPVKGKACKILAVVASRHYLFHGDITKLLNSHP